MLFEVGTLLLPARTCRCGSDHPRGELPRHQASSVRSPARPARSLSCSLSDVGCKTVANMIKGKSPEEIRKTFNIQNDFTPEEEEQIRRENEWAEDR